MAPPEITDVREDDLYAWIDEIPLSRPKRNIQRDFSDGVATAEVVKHFLPKLVDLHNYPSANAVGQKFYNWKTLNQKVFRRLGYQASQELIDNIVHNRPGHVEFLLHELRLKIDAYLTRQSQAHQQSTKATFPNNPASMGGRWSQVSPDTNQSHTGGEEGLPSLPERASVYAGMATAGMPRASVNPQHPPHSDSGHGDPGAHVVSELQETVEMLQIKITKLEQLLELKERRIGELTLRLRSHGLA
ncbi:hypothetical protein DFS34DRAFT_251118 [Phlyctochytrium arcticum]|nr:hypothetical protein DFS34DRAFT_251118 [Phlyctochytrium arcticum]